MRANVLEQHGGPEVLQVVEREIPEPGPREVRVRVRAAACPLAFLTAWTMLIERATLRPGERVLVLGGGSGVGSAAIQIARLWGARVLATAGDEIKRRKCRVLGAEEVVDHSGGSFAKAVKAWSGGRGVEVVFEHVGAATWEQSMRCLARGGRLVTCGATTGHEVPIDLRHLFFKNLTVLGSTMGSLATMREVWAHLREGRLRPVIDHVIPLEEVAAGHRRIDEREQFGKVVLTL